MYILIKIVEFGNFYFTAIVVSWYTVEYLSNLREIGQKNKLGLYSIVIVAKSETSNTQRTCFFLGE